MNKLNQTETLKVTDSTFEQEVLNANEPVLVDFWAAWCGPCRTIAPVIEELAVEYQGRLRVTKVNVDENPEAPSHFGIRSIPTLMLFKDGELKEQVVGVQPKSQLNGLINRYVQ